MTDPHEPQPQGAFRDLVPWADPYIVSLVEKLRNEQRAERSLSNPRGELAPPLDSGHHHGSSRRQPTRRFGWHD